MKGLQATRKQKENPPATSVLVLTAHSYPQCLLRAVEAAGYALKGASPDDVVGAVRSVIRGESPVDSKLAMQVMRGISRHRSPTTAQPEDPGVGSLTSRKMGVDTLVGSGGNDTLLGDQADRVRR